MLLRQRLSTPVVFTAAFLKTPTCPLIYLTPKVSACEPCCVLLSTIEISLQKESCLSIYATLFLQFLRGNYEGTMKKNYKGTIWELYRNYNCAWDKVTYSPTCSAQQVASFPHVKTSIHQQQSCRLWISKIQFIRNKMRGLRAFLIRQYEGGEREREEKLEKR